MRTLRIGRTRNVDPRVEGTTTAQLFTVRRRAGSYKGRWHSSAVSASQQITRKRTATV